MKLNEIVAYDRLTAEDLEEIMNVRSGRKDEVSYETYEKLFSIYMREMPYGTAKARTGDPYQWISNKIMRMSEDEFRQLVASHSGIRGLGFKNRPRRRM